MFYLYTIRMNYCRVLWWKHIITNGLFWIWMMTYVRISRSVHLFLSLFGVALYCLLLLNLLCNHIFSTYFIHYISLLSHRHHNFPFFCFLITFTLLAHSTVGRRSSFTPSDLWSCPLSPFVMILNVFAFCCSLHHVTLRLWQWN